MVLNYPQHVLSAWRAARADITKRQHDRDIEYSAECPEGFPDFGVLDRYVWTFKEQDGVLDMHTVMDNFDMEAWMDYIGGIIYRDCGSACNIRGSENIIRPEIS